MKFQNIPIETILVLLIQIFWIILFFFVIERLFIRMIKKEKLYDRLKFYIPLIKNIVWCIFIARTIYIIGKHEPIIVLFTTIIFVGLTWNVLKDFVQGIIFKLQRGNVLGQQIQLNKYKGKIVKMDNTKVNIEQKNGEIVQIPYTELFKNIVTKPTESSEIKSQTITFTLKEKTDTEKLKKTLISKIISNPWVAVKNGVDVEFFYDDKQELKVKISYYLLSIEKSFIIQKELTNLVMQQ